MVYGSNSALGTTQLVDSLNISKERYMNRNDHHSIHVQISEKLQPLAF